MGTHIAQTVFAGLGIVGLALCAVPVHAQDAGKSYESTYSQYVSEDGTLRVPETYREDFVFLGSFSVAAGDEAGSAKELHQVYVDPDSVAYYRETGQFPDGAMIVKELQGTGSMDLTTGHASFWAENHGWFAMIKDTKGRHSESGLWGDGWGWAFFDKADPTTPVTKNYKEECVSCHMPVQSTDWLHVWAYPLLEAQDTRSKFGQ